MMGSLDFKDVVQYTDFVVGRLVQWRPDCSEELLEGVVRRCAEAYPGYLDSVRRGGSGGTSSGLLLLGGGSGGAEAAVAGIAGAVDAVDVGVAGVGPGHGGCPGAGFGGNAGVVKGAPTVSPRTLANRAKRAAAKQRKLRKQAAVGAGPSAKDKEDVGKPVSAGAKSDVTPEWRRGAGPGRGFFAECAEDVRKELRESRAKLLIAENKRRAAIAEAKLRRLNSPMAAVEEAMRAVAFAEKLAKREGDKRVIGWAKTVTANYVESVSGGASGSIGSGSGGTNPTSVSATSSCSQEYKKKENLYGLQRMTANAVEAWLMARGILDETALVRGRAKVKGHWTAEIADYALRLKPSQIYELQGLEQSERAAAYADIEDYI